MYKVFFKDRTLFLTDTVDDNLAMNAHAIYKFDTSNRLKKFISGFLDKDSMKTAVVYSYDMDKMFDAFKSIFIDIQAAGGLVFNSKGEFIGLYRRGKNDLPKGKLEKGESAEDGAVREVQEECGLRNVEILDKLTDTYHIYFIDDKPVLKQTHWFKMFTEDKVLIPQTEEDIEDIFWVSEAGLHEFMDNTYHSVTEVIKAAGLV